MGLKSTKILGISVTTSPKQDILEYIQKYLENPSGKPLVIATPNPEQIVAAQGDPHFAKMLGQADVALPDGVGLAFVARCARIPGVEFMEDLVEMASQRGYPIGLIGGRGGVAVEALECLKQKYPCLTGWAYEPGEFKLDQLDQFDQYVGNIREKIHSTNTRLVFVGLGAPKQEYLIEAISHQLSAIRQSEDGRLKTDSSCVFMSVGGSFDMIAGRMPRAPFILRTIGLEWLWRLVREPWRWKRQRALLQFLWLVLGKKIEMALRPQGK